MAKILLVEDEVDLARLIQNWLTREHHLVEIVNDGNLAINQLKTYNYDLVLLDIMLPGMDGFEICNRIREQSRDQAIIMLTAKSNDEDIIQGLSLGADDYVSKPFSVAQLVLRVQAVLRRTAASNPVNDVIVLSPGVQIDCQNLSGTRGKESLSFTCREIALLQYLQAHSERPVSRDELLHKVWGYADDLSIETRTVDIHVAKLRRKIEADSSSPEFLVTVRGAGYRLISQS